MDSTILIVIILVIVILQIFFFVRNIGRMRQFKDIFSHPDSWKLKKDLLTDSANGVAGDGNEIFNDIVSSINEYVVNRTGSEVDFGLIKDAVDRHCDAIDDDIAAQNPIPLYCGLAGTMAGVIIGLVNMDLSNLAESGINALLNGVALAMVASICGLILTTANILCFKKYKLDHESGKNTFLVWMQSELLPEFPADTSEALNNLVKNLRSFNKTFAQNTSNFEAVLTTVDVSAASISKLHDDVKRNSEANLQVLRALQGCTGKLEQFNLYLDSIQGYTTAIHRFEEQFQKEAERIHVLEEVRNSLEDLRDYFNRHKGEIAQTVTDADNAIQTALATIKESTRKNINELNVQFSEQGEEFKKVLEVEVKTFEQFTKDFRVEFERVSKSFQEALSEYYANLTKRLPDIGKQIEVLSSFPDRLEKLVVRIEESNKKLADNISKANRGGGGGLSLWKEIVIGVALFIIVLSCVANAIFSLLQRNNAVEFEPAQFHITVYPEDSQAVVDSLTVVSPDAFNNSLSAPDSSSANTVDRKKRQER